MMRSGGFSMMEVLVTLVVVSVGLLATAGLLLHSMKANQSGLLRSQAVFLLGDLTERMEANRRGAVALDYNVGASQITAGTNCATSVCDVRNTALYDVAQWQEMVGTLPGATTNVTRVAGSTNPVSYDITITWAERRGGKTNYASAGETETMSLTTRKQIYCVSAGSEAC